MSDLRSKIIRLAYEKPEYRDQLLPLVQKTAGGKARAQISTQTNTVTIFLGAKRERGNLTGPYATFKTLDSDWKVLKKIVQKAMKVLQTNKDVYLTDLDDVPQSTPELALNPNPEVFAHISWAESFAQSLYGEPLTTKDALPGIIQALESIGLTVTVK